MYLIQMLENKKNVYKCTKLVKPYPIYRGDTHLLFDELRTCFLEYIQTFELRVFLSSLFHSITAEVLTEECNSISFVICTQRYRNNTISYHLLLLLPSSFFRGFQT